MIDRTWELMQEHLEMGVYFIASSHNSVPSEERLRAVARGLGCKLPDDFVAHSTNKYGGLYVEVKEELWSRPKEFDVGPFWSFLYGLYTLNATDGIPDFMSLETEGSTFQQESGFTVVPFLKVIGDADCYCFDERGAIARWDHELNDLTQIDKSFFDVLDDETICGGEKKIES